ncbi:Zn-dependent hydrolase [Bacillus dakarensis]|uniref:Zn-dependent hydrolase n=1 Tax=Robertmurraya dakarensis TaxID=1926278 RepID=UPI00098147F9|nr:Zn-dependent hydrolase [Bacillus dakarensis]
MNLKAKLLNGFQNKYEVGFNEERIAERLSQLASIGLTEEGGSNRIAYTKEERAAKEMVKKWIKEILLEVYEDEAGNVFGRLNGKDTTLPAVLVGSHVDTVPNGGHFDGTLGVLTALEVVQTWTEEAFIPDRNLEIVIFSDEEGVRFDGGLTGSRVMMGEADAGSLREDKDEDGVTFAEALRADGLDIDLLDKAVRNPKEIHAFVELHIEQGKVLERQDCPVGIVTGIAGPVNLWVQFNGEAGHAGNTPMGQRLDALAASSEFMTELEKMPGRFSETAVATVGKIDVYPGGSNVIPGRVELIVDVRDIYLESRDSLLATIEELALKIAERRGLQVVLDRKLRVDPVLIQDGMKEIVKDAVESSGFQPVLLPSGAAHDAMIMGRHVPTAMIFVRSQDGISHNPKEWTTLDDIMAGCKVLSETLKQLVAG